MTLEAWPPLHKRLEFRMRPIRLVIVGAVIVPVAANLLTES